MKPSFHKVIMHATLSLSTQSRNGRTVLKECYATPPLKLIALPPHDRTLHAVQMSSSPGLLAGDVIDTSITLAAHTSLALYTQAFTRVLSMNAGDAAQQHTRIGLAEGSSLTFLPHPLVLHAGSTLLQTTEITLDNNAELLYGEILAAGRVRNGEAFAFERLSSRLTILHQNRLLLTDNIQWQPARHPLGHIGQMKHYTHQLNLFYVHTGDADLAAQLENLHQCLSENHTDHSTDLLWGISRSAPRALCLRALATDAQILQNLLHRAVTLLSPRQAPPSAVFFR